uniref:Protein kinase domain-containing protein n=1 Tax=Rhabditophanes sp. KR3021 TaxID=114890 RepID=A0AC35U5C1_9BILA
MAEPELMYLYELPSLILKKLCELLDLGESWKLIALHSPLIKYRDVLECQKCGSTGSATEAFIRLLASKGYLVADFYKNCARAGSHECLAILKHVVPIKYHELESMCTSKFDINVTSTRNYTTKGCSKSLQSSSINGSVKSSGSINTSQNSQQTTSMSSSIKSSMENTMSVNYKEILLATQNFASENILGTGGYATVFKGNWKQMEVAIKRLTSKNEVCSAKKEKERLKQSFQELKTLSKYRHDNILPLYGFSMDGPEPCLVYQFMANGSVEDRILCRRKSTPLDWEQRMGIARGSARALVYLHSIPHNPIIHGDVKTANILLSYYMEPKLGDFGLSRDTYSDSIEGVTSSLIASHIKGTLAYLPSEFLNKKIISTKLDVYSFGVVLLELATGLKPYSDAYSPHGLVDYVKYQNGITKGNNELLAEILMDPNASQFVKKNNIFNNLLTSGIESSESNYQIRPSIEHIASKLLI